MTDEQLVATIGPHGEVELTLATDNKCVSTDNDALSCNRFAGKYELLHEVLNILHKCFYGNLEGVLYLANKIVPFQMFNH